MASDVRLAPGGIHEQACGLCGNIHNKLGDNKVFMRPSCGLQCDRDKHATRNILGGPACCELAQRCSIDCARRLAPTKRGYQSRAILDCNAFLIEEIAVRMYVPCSCSCSVLITVEYMRGGVIATFIVILLFAASASCFLFGRSSVVEPPSLGPPKAFATTDRATRSIVIIHDPVILANAPVHMSIATAFWNGTAAEYTTVTRELTSLRGYSLLSTNIYISEDGEVAAACFAPPHEASVVVIARISLRDWTVMSLTPFPSTYMAWLFRGFIISRYNSTYGGSEFALLIEDNGLTWQLPSGIIVTLSMQPSMWYLLGSDLYVLCAYATLPSVAFRVDLTTGNVTESVPFSFAALDDTSCAFLVEPSSPTENPRIAFLELDNSVRQLAFVDIVTLNISAVALAGEVPYKSGFALNNVQCAPSGVPNQFFAFDSSGLSVIDLANATTSVVALSDHLQYWVSGEVLPNGNMLVAACDFPISNGMPDEKVCELQWFDSVNVSSTAPIMPYSTVQFYIVQAEYLYTQLIQDWGMFYLEDQRLHSHHFSVLYINMSLPEQTLAWVAVSHRNTTTVVDFSVDSLTLGIVFQAHEYTGEPNARVFLYRIDWRSQLLPPDVASCYYIGRWIGTNAVTDVVAYNHTVVSYVPFTDTTLLYLTQLSPRYVTLTANTTIDTSSIEQLIWVTNDMLLVRGKWQILLLDSMLQNVVHTWLAPPYTQVSVLSDDHSTLYTWGNFNNPNGTIALCSYVSLLPPNNANFTTRAMHQRNPEDTVWSNVVAAFSQGSIYFAMIYATMNIQSFSLTCEPQNEYDTRLAMGGSLTPFADRVFFGKYPVLSPVYLDCGTGKFRNVTDAICMPCPNNSVNAMQDTQACVPCPVRSAPDPTSTYCLCQPGYYSSGVTAECDVCPVGGVCAGGNSLLPAPGYWRPNATSSEFYACPFELGCNGSNVCARGYTGPLCAVCERKYALVITDCLSCASPLLSAVYWVVAFLVYLGTFIALLYSANSSFSVLKSFISFAQIVTFPASGPIPHLLEQKLRLVSRFFSLANLQVLSVVSPDCVLGWHLNFPTEAVLAAVMPLLIILALVGLFALPWQSLRSRICCKAAPASSSFVNNDLFNESKTSTITERIASYKQSGTALRVILFVILLSTPSATQQLASFFNCQRVSGIAYLVRDFTVRCYSSLWVAFSAPVAILFCLYAVGVPAGLFYLLYRYRDKLDVRFLHSSYTDEYYWWDITEQCRKLALLLLNTALAPHAPNFAAPCSLSVSIVALSIHLRVQPYAKMRDFWFQCADLAGVCLFFMWSVLPSDDESADVLAWIYWIFAVCYAAASLSILLIPIGQWIFAGVRKRFCVSKEEIQSELDPLVPRRNGDLYG